VVIGSKVGESFYDPRESRAETLPAIDLQGEVLAITLTKTNDEGETTTRNVRLRVAGARN
jgi:hypothetical protein